MSHLRGCVTVLEIVFVGQCEVFVCLDFVHFFPLAFVGQCEVFVCLDFVHFFFLGLCRTV